MTDTIEPQSTDEALAVIDLPTPIARVMGQPMTQLPLDLYIPPDALEVILEQFEGPLDLLLYLIRKQNLDILDVNVTDIVDQYMQYIDMMNAMQLELAGEYLLMAATLAEIKSRVLLPRHRDDDHEVIDDEDPRAELIRRLQEYERFKQAAEDLEALPREERDNFTLHLDIDNRQINRTPPDVSMREIMLAMAEVLRRAERTEHHEIQRETLSTRERMIQIIDQLQSGEFKPLTSLIGEREGRLGVVVTFLAILELVKEKTLELVQQEAFGPIHVRLRAVE